MADPTTKTLVDSSENITFGVVSSWADTEITVAVTVGGTPPYTAGITLTNDVGASGEFDLSVIAS